MLHGIDQSGSTLSMTVTQLASLIDSIRGAGHQVVPLLDLLENPNASDGRVALTFDDGFASVADGAAPVLLQKSAPATLFLTTGWMGRDNGWPSQPADAQRVPMMNWDEVATLAASGWSIEAHTVNHPDLRTLDDQELETEFCQPLDEIEEHCGRRPSVIAYPYGYFDDRVVERAGSHYRFGLTTCLGEFQDRPSDPMKIPRLDVYYLRSPRVHRRFGRPDFRLYMHLRRGIRRLRGHPGEIE